MASGFSKMAFLRSAARHLISAFGLGAAFGCSLPGPASDRAVMRGFRHEQLPLPAPLHGNLHAVSAGDPAGCRVVFVHGTPGSADGWRDFLAEVPEGFEYVAVDRPGFGESDPEDAVVSLEMQADALLPLLAQGRRTLLVGHSLGGPVVAEAALRAPGKVGGILILAGSLDPDLEEIHPLQHIGRVWPVRSLLPRAIRNSNEELFALEAELRRLDTRLPQMEVPVRIVHGDEDPLVPVANVDYMRRRLPAAEIRAVELLPGRDHYLPWKERARIEAGLRALAWDAGCSETDTVESSGGRR